MDDIWNKILTEYHYKFSDMENIEKVCQYIG